MLGDIVRDASLEQLVGTVLQAPRPEHDDLGVDFIRNVHDALPGRRADPTPRISGEAGPSGALSSDLCTRHRVGSIQLLERSARDDGRQGCETLGGGQGWSEVEHGCAARTEQRRRSVDGAVRYLAFYFAGGFAATMTQTAMTLLFGTALDSRVPNLGASGAIAAVLGAYFVLYPNSTVRGLAGIWPVRLSAWVFLGFWFLYQLFEANFGLFRAQANGGGVAFFAHVGGFVSGALIARVLLGKGRIAPQPARSRLALP
jgi:hypothetical protein